MRSTPEPVFIVGPPRSGTTLLSLMLGRHPQIAFVGEFEWTWDFPLGTGDVALTAYVEWLQTNRHYLHHGPEIDASLDFDGLVRSFLDQMWEQGDPGHRKPLVGVQLHRHYHQAHRTWPRARFIHIVRDGRDVCASWIAKGWTGNGFVAGERWNRALEDWRTLEPSIPADRAIEVRFETLVQDPGGELGKLCAFLGVEYSDELLDYHTSTTYDPVDPEQARKWPRSLSRRDLRLFESQSGDQLTRAGYPPSGEPPRTRLPAGILRLDNALRQNAGRVRNFGFAIWFAELFTRRLRLQTWHDRIQHRINAIENTMLQ